MMELRAKLEAGHRLTPGQAGQSAQTGQTGPAGHPVYGTLCLKFDRRQKSRQRVVLTSGEDALVILPRGAYLRGGERLLSADGRIVEVVAEPEEVLHVECADPTALARAAYHLGNRHVPVEIGTGYLRLAPDHVLAAMLRGLGAAVTERVMPFEPEAGAYGHEHPPHGDEQGGRGEARIHEYGTHGRHD